MAKIRESDNVAMDMRVQHIGPSATPVRKERIADILFTKPAAHAAYLAGLADFVARGGVVTRVEQDGTVRYFDPVSGHRIAAESIANVSGFARRKAA